MSFLREIDGEWLVCARGSSNTAGRKYKKMGAMKKGHEHCSYRIFYIVKHNGEFCGDLHLGTLTLPKKFIGKRVKIKVEVLEDENETINC